MSEHRLPRRGDWRREGPHSRKRVRPLVEGLEDRPLLDAASFAAPDPAATPSASSTPTQQIAGVDYPDYLLLGSEGASETPLATAGPTGTTPAQIRHAYGFDQISFNGGTVAGDGSGTTIAIVDAFNDPNIAGDLHQFDLQFGIPDPPVFTQVNQTGGSKLPAANTGWINEISLDVEWAHAIAPGADILLVEANSSSNANLDTAAAYAAKQPGVVAVSMSFGGSEFAGEVAADSTFLTPNGHAGVTFVASSGDKGAPISQPASSPNVLAVGGTTLSLDSSGNILSESGWSGSGGGISVYEPQPSYQSGVVTQSPSARTNPDVAYDADPNTGFPVYDSYNNSASTPWSQFGGTSDAAPQWAALIAIADQGRALAGLGSLDGRTQTLPSLYTLPTGDYNDITTGGSTGSPAFSAAAGYDLVTGLGTPSANQIVTGLIPAVVGSNPAVGSTVSTPPTSYAISFSLPVNPSSLQASAFTVDGITASSVTLDGSGTTATFTFNANPVASQGLQTMQLAAGAVSVAGDPGMTFAAFTGTFTSTTQPLATPTIVWPTPADVTYGTSLGSAQLDATASFAGSTVMGVFIYTPAAGTMLNAGAGQTLAVSFTPDDPTSYSTATATVSINVDPAPLVVTVAAATKVYGQSNPAFGVGYQGFVPGQTASVLGGNLSFTTTATAASFVGSYTVSAGGLTSSNYAVSFAAGTLTVTQAPLAVAPGNASRLYGAANPSFTGTLTGLENNDPITAVYTTTANMNSDEGTYPITATLNDPANRLGNYMVTSGAGALTITLAPLVVTADSFARLYGAANPTLTGTLAGVENGDAITASFSTAANASSPAGPYTITAALSGAKLFDYTVTASTGTLTVNVAPLVVTVSAATKVYGQPDPAFSATYQGFVMGQTMSVLGGSLTFSTTATAASGIGGYGVSPGGLTSGNYAISFAPGTLTVTQAPLVVAPATASRLYGAANPVFTGTLTGLENNDPITAVYTTPANLSSDAGTYPITGTLNDPANRLVNYMVTTGAGTLTITRAPLSATPDSFARLYGAANPTLTGTLAGVENSDAITASFSTPANASSLAGVYSISAVLLGAKLYDYTVTASTGTLTVNVAPLVVTVNAASKVYGQSNPAFGVSYQGFVLGQTANVVGGSLTFSTIATAASGVGGYTVSASGLTSTNYAISYADGTLNVMPAPLSVVPGNASRPYGAASTTLTGTLAGLENNDPITAVYTTSAAINSDTGSYPITAALIDPGHLLGNYTMTFSTGSLTVTAAPLAVAVADASKVYGAANPTFDAVFQGFLPGQTASALGGDLIFETTATAASGVGSYTVSASGLTSSDYAISYADGTLNVMPAPLVVVPDDQSRLYGAANPTLTGTIAGLENDDPIAAVYTTAAVSTSDTGTYSITATLSDPTHRLANYAVTESASTLTVTPAPLLVTPDSITRLYGAANPTLTGTLSGVQNGDAISVTYGTPADASSAVGSYVIDAKLAGANLGDYDVTADNAMLTVTPAPLTVSVSSASKVYGAADPAFTVAYQGYVLGQDASVLGGTLTYTTAATAGSAVGSYTVSASGLTASNYAITYATGTLIVTPAPLSVIPVNVSRLYGAANPALMGTITGVQHDDSITAIYSTTADSTSDTGNYAITASLDGNALANYAVTSNLGTLTVTAAPVVVTPDSLFKTYGAANPALTGTLAGVQNGDVLTVSYSTPASTTGAVGLYGIAAELSGPQAQDYTVTVAPATLTITPALLVVTVADSSRVYGAAAPAFQLGFQGFVLGQDPGVLSGTPTFATTADRASPVGTYPVTAGGLTVANYALSFAAGTLTVTPAPLTVTPANISRVYGAANPALSGTIAGSQNGDPISATYTTSAAAASDVGDYPIVATLDAAATTLANYDVITNPATLTVDPAPLTVTADNASKVAGEANPDFTAGYAGFVLGQGPGALSGTLSFQTPAGASSPAGQYPITPGGLQATNYAIAYTAGMLEVASPAGTLVVAPPAGTLVVAPAAGTLVVAPAAIPSVTVVSVQLQTHKLPRKKTVKVLVVEYSGALEPGAAQAPVDYQLVAPGKHRTFGIRGTRAVAIASATYNPVAQSVTLTPAGKLPPGPLKLTIVASGILDAQGRALDGNGDGQPGGNFEMTLAD